MLPLLPTQGGPRCDSVFQTRRGKVLTRNLECPHVPGGLPVNKAGVSGQAGPSYRLFIGAGLGGGLARPPFLRARGSFGKIKVRALRGVPCETHLGVSRGLSCEFPPWDPIPEGLRPFVLAESFLPRSA